MGIFNHYSGLKATSFAILGLASFASYFNPQWDYNKSKTQHLADDGIVGIVKNCEIKAPDFLSGLPFGIPIGTSSMSLEYHSKDFKNYDLKAFTITKSRWFSPPYIEHAAGTLALRRSGPYFFVEKYFEIHDSNTLTDLKTSGNVHVRLKSLVERTEHRFYEFRLGSCLNP